MVLLPLQQLSLPMKPEGVLVLSGPEVVIIPGGVTGLGSFSDIDGAV